MKKKKNQLFKYLCTLLADPSEWEVNSNKFFHKKTGIQLYMSQYTLVIENPAETKFGWLETNKLRRILTEMQVDTNLRAVLKGKTK